MNIPFRIFRVHGDSGSDRGGPGPVIGYAQTKEAADFAAEGKGWWGGKGSVTEGWGMMVNNQIYALEQKEPIQLHKAVRDRVAELRESALAKLSEDEKKALGLK